MKQLITAFALFASSEMLSQTLNDNLLAYFPLNGSATDAIGGLIPIDTTGSPVFCSDAFGNAGSAACFDGNSLWSYGDVLDLGTSDFSIAFWCRVDFLQDGDQDLDYVLAKGMSVSSQPAHSGYAAGFVDPTGSNPELYVAVGDQTDSPIWLGEGTSFSNWHHAVYSRCDGMISFHYNGVLVQTAAFVNADISTDTYFSIGAVDRRPSNAGITGHLNGAVDDLRIYEGRCLSQAEIDTLAVDLLSVGVDEQVQPRSGLSPNPVRDQLTITCAVTQVVEGRCVIMDAVGRPVMDLRLTAERTVVGVADLPAGTYFLVVQDDRGLGHRRFTKE